jgi:CRP/FNR family transcriptional regulator, anaerobic regulatory protein
MSELGTYIRSYFGVASTEDVQQIEACFNTHTLHKGEYYVKAGLTCSKMCFVQSGYLRVFASTTKKEITQWISSAGYFCTDLSSFINGTPSRWNIQALEDTEVFSINTVDYFNLGKTITNWKELEKLFMVRCFTLLEERIFNHLALSAEERYKQFYKYNADLFNRVPLQYIASMLGMTPETLSRLRKKLSK